MIGKPGLINRCPWCERALRVERWHCPHCDVHFEGKVPTCALPDWTAEEWEFVKVFLLSEGNIRATEKVLGISYPTVKQKLAVVIKKLKTDPPQGSASDAIGDVLNQLAAGNISEQEAEKAIAKLKKKD